jgi:ABC-type polysaccharide/polyol phosphate export permease
LLDSSDRADQRRYAERSRVIAHANAITERTSEEPRFRPLRRIREIYGYREILGNLIRKELKVKYTASVLGAVWSLLNPLVFLAVFTFLVKVLGNDMPHYAVFLISGLLAWNLFSVAFGNGTRVVIDNANLVKKVAFPREILPLSTVGVALVDFGLQSAVLLIFMVVSGYGFHLEALLLYPLSFVTLVVFTTAVTFWASAVNVRYRDVQHLIGLALIVWFWLTPIVYPGAQVQAFLLAHSSRVNLWNLFMLNPLTPIVLGFQRALYFTVAPMTPNGPLPVLPLVSVAWLVAVIGGMLLICLGLLVYTWRLYFRLSGDFAEEL